MEVSGLKLDRGRILNAIKILPTGEVLANEPLEIHIPKQFVKGGLATITDKVDTILVVGIVTKDGCYSNWITPAHVTMIPSNMTDVNVNGEKYTVMEFERGDTVIENLEVPLDDRITYSYYMEFCEYGRLPWYFLPEDLPGLFDEAKYYAGKEVGTTPQVFRMLVALMFRDPTDPERAYRYSKAINEGLDPLVVGLNNGTMLIDGTFNKLIGGYLNDNTVSAILKPDTRVTDTERVIKGIPDE